VEEALSKDELFNKLLSGDDTLKLTSLRKDVLEIFMAAEKPISAYDVLSELKKIRANAEPPTAYRVIDYFVEKNIIHRIDAENKYVFCTQIDGHKKHCHGIIFICKKCLASNEIIDQSSAQFFEQLASKFGYVIDGAPVEVKGLCQSCCTA